MKKYIHNTLVGFDQFCNTLIGGKPDETISARAGRAAQAGKLWGKVLCGGLNLIQKNHCTKAEAGDEVRSETVDDIEMASYAEMTPPQKEIFNHQVQKDQNQK
jgi:hypothetical protein